jgi:trigger factor
MSVGEEKNVNVTFPEDYQQEKLAGRPVVFEVKMNGIKRKELPVLDDEFAKEISETADTLAELREETCNRLEEQAMANANIVCQKDAIKMVVDKAEMDIPPVMIEHKMDDIVKRMEDQLAMNGLTMEAFLEYTKNTREDLRESYKEQAEFDVRQDLVLEEIIKAENIEVTEEEIAKELEALAARYWQPAEKIRESLEQNGQINNLIFSIKMMKAGDLVFDTAVITEEFITKDTEKTTKKAKKEKKLEV